MTYQEYIKETVTEINDRDYFIRKNNDFKCGPEHGLIYIAAFHVLDQKVTISIEDILEVVRYETTLKEPLQLFYKILFVWKAYIITGGAAKLKDDLEYVISQVKK